MAKVDTASIIVTIGFLVISASLYYKFWYLSTDTDYTIRFLTIFVFGGTLVLVMGCVAKYFGMTQESLEKLK